MPNITNITPPRVAIIDPRTGAITREWYRFFYNLFYATGGTTNGAIPVDRGGTGLTTLVKDGILYADTDQSFTINDKLTFDGTDFATTGAVNAGTNVTAGGDVTAGDDVIATGDVTAGANVNVGGYISAPTYIEFDTTPNAVTDVARLSWNASDQTLDLGMEYDVTQQIGQETYARVRNNTGSTIPNGTVVGFAGAATDALLVTPYLADGSLPSLYILGVMTHDLPDSGEKGYCTTWGFVRDINTSAFAVGDVLYASPTTAGGLTNVKPTAPNNVIPVAACITSDATTGVIFVRPTIQQMQYYGVFAKTSDQTPAVINTAYAVTFDSTRISNGVVIGTPTSRIIVPESGLYQIQATIQLGSGSSSAKNVWVWYRKNGTDIANSARIVTLDINNGYIPVSVNEPISLAANDYIELMFAADSTSVTIDAVASTAFAPAAPAVVLEVTQIQQ